MNIHTALLRHPTKPYYQQPSLLLQFILLDLAAAYQLILRLEEFVSNQSDDTLQQPIDSPLGKNMRERLFPLCGAEGHLEKLKQHCALLLCLLGLQEEVISLDRSAQQAGFLSTHCLELLPELTLQAWLHTLDQLKQNVRQMALLIKQIVLQFHDDENLIFFLLRHQIALDTLYATAFVETILHEMFPEKNLMQVSDFLIMRYTQRGFDYLADQINQYLIKLDGQ